MKKVIVGSLLAVIFILLPFQAADPLGFGGRPLTVSTNLPLNLKGYHSSVTNGADITLVLSNAITQAVSQNRAVQIPAGNYFISTLTNSSNPVLLLDDGARLIHKTNAVGHMIHMSGGSLTIRGNGILDGDKANQASTSTNYFAIIYAKEPDIQGVVFTNAMRAAILDFQSTNRVSLKGIKSFNQHPLATNTLFANAAFIIAPGQAQSSVDVLIDDVYMENEVTSNRYPGGLYLAGSDGATNYLRVTLNSIRGNRVGDDHAIGASHYGIAFLDCYEDLQFLHATSLSVTNSRYIGLKIQNTAHAKINKANIHTTGTVGLNYTPGERSQSSPYVNAQFTDITVYGDPSRTYGFYLSAGDAGGFYNVSLDGFYGESLFRLGEVEGFDLAGNVEGFGPVLLKNINGVAGSGIVARGLAGSLTMRDCDYWSTNGSAFVMTQTNTSAVVTLVNNKITSTLGGNVTVRGVAALIASGNRLNAVTNSHTAVNLEDDANGANILSLQWDQNNIISTGVVSTVTADIDAGYMWVGTTKTTYPSGMTETIGNGTATYVADYRMDYVGALLAWRFRNLAAGGGLSIVLGAEDALGSISVLDDTFADGDRADRFSLRAESTASGADLDAVGTGANVRVRATTAGGKVDLIAGGSTSTGLRVDDSAIAGNTRVFIYDVDNAALERVTVGAADSGGSGYKLLRVPN
jgi:hypothetical protein